VHSIERFLDAFDRFVSAIGSVGWTALGLALGFHLLNLVLRTRAWRNIVAAAYPGTRVRWRWTFGAYCAGVGVNGVVPARGGDVVKLFLLHTRVRGATYPTLASTLVAETLFDLVMGVSLLAWAWTLGVVPALPSLPDLPAFEWSWLAQNPTVTITVLAVVAAALALGLVWLDRRVRALWARLRQGLAILVTPKRYLESVVTLQALGWCCRVASAYYFLEAFHVPATFRNALLVIVVQAAATSLPLTPGGLGPKQALLVVLLAGEAARGTLLAFSVGMELAILAFNLALGLGCMAVMLKGFHFRQAIAEARAAQTSPPPDPAPGDPSGSSASIGS
jgi:glycosyltransferase 2 family protein